jgi:hypothetical protein
MEMIGLGNTIGSTWTPFHKGQDFFIRSPPMAFGYYIAIAPIYILSPIELEAKKYGMKNSIVNLMNQFSCTLDATILLEYTSQGRVLLLLVSKQNMKPSFWRI